MKHEVIILGSECARVDHYAERVVERVRALGVSEEDCGVSRVRSTGDEESVVLLERCCSGERAVWGGERVGVYENSPFFVLKVHRSVLIRSFCGVYPVPVGLFRIAALDIEK